MERKVGGKSVQDVFSEPRLATLARAACDGDDATVARAIKDGADPNGKGFDDVTPLYWAVNCQNLHGVEALLRAGANPNYMFGGRFSAVYAASTMEESAMLKLLLKYGGDPNTKDNKSNKTALEEALSLGIHGADWDNYYALLNLGADINRADAMGDTIAKAAAALGRFDKVAELLERGYRTDLPDLGRTVQIRRVDPKSEQAEWQAKVKVMLEQKGVQFPVPPKVRP
jgi:ankyrin repeat protein